jgi:hypothetical protein
VLVDVSGMAMFGGTESTNVGAVAMKVIFKKVLEQQ